MLKFLKSFLEPEEDTHQECFIPSTMPVPESLMQAIKEHEPSESDKLVMEIHNEFDTAPERLLKSAEDLVNEERKHILQKDLAIKSQRLSKLGFNAAKVVTLSEENRQKVEKEEAERGLRLANAQLVTYYKQKYPYMKFLTIEELNRICEKYNLIHASVSRYVGDVPEKNLKQIENAQPLKVEDFPEQFVQRARTFTGDRLWESLSFDNFLTEYNAFQSVKKVLPVNNFTKVKDEKGLENLFPVSAFSKYEHISYFLSNTAGLQIAAPEHLFEKKNSVRIGNHLVDAPPPVNRDPVVFKYCKGGILVISKWGLEADDELLINPVEN